MNLRFLRELFTKPRILIYADFIDPFCYIGFHTLRPLAERQGIVLDWRGFEFNPDTPGEGYRLETGPNSDLRPGMWASVAALARKSGLALSEPAYVPNTGPAHELVEWAKPLERTPELIEAIFASYFLEGLDISRRDVLGDLAKRFSVPKTGLLSDPRYPKRLEQHRQEALRHMFPGLPGFLYRGKRLFGALSQDAWEKEIRCSTK